MLHNDHEIVPLKVDADKAWIQTFMGHRFHLLDPRPEEIQIVDIAHALGMLCRFTGHVREFYSVAEHSVFASQFVPKEDALWALMHDSSEAYAADVNRPLKHYTPIGPVYKEVEGKIMDAICDRFGLPREMPQSVHDADIKMLYTEKEQLMSTLDWSTKWSFDESTAGVVLPCWGPKKAGKMFLKRFKELTGEKQ